MKMIKRMRKNESGQSLVEYALIIGLIAVVAVTTLGLIGDNITAHLETIETELQ